MHRVTPPDHSDKLDKPDKPDKPDKIISFRVQVGHNTLNVQGASAEEAVREAKRRLCLELPRMWDVIQSLDDSRFQVSPIIQ